MIDCGDTSCYFREDKSKTVRTNGGCSCFEKHLGVEGKSTLKAIKFLLPSYLKEKQRREDAERALGFYADIVNYFNDEDISDFSNKAREYFTKYKDNND